MKKLDFNAHLTYKIVKPIEILEFLRKLQNKLLTHTLLTIHKPFTKPYSDYVDTVYDQPTNDYFFKKLH